MSFLSRLTADQEHFTFTLSIDRVVFPSASPSTLPPSLFIRLIRGSTTLKTDAVEPLGTTFTFSNLRPLETISTFYKRKDGGYIKKDGRIVLIALSKGEEREIGKVDFNVADFVSAPSNSKVEWKVEKCAVDSAAKITARITLKPKEGGKGGDKQGGEKKDENEVKKATKNGGIKASADGKKKDDDDDDDEDDDDEVDQKKKLKKAAPKKGTTKKSSSDDEDEEEEEEEDDEEDEEDDDDDEDEDGGKGKKANGNAKKAVDNKGKGSEKGKKKHSDDEDDEEDEEEDDDDEEEEEEDDSPKGKNAPKNNKEKPKDNAKHVAFESKKAPPPSQPPSSSAAPSKPIIPIRPSDLFNCTLDQAMTLNPKSTPPLTYPSIVDTFLNAIDKNGGLMTEGIFRTSPNMVARDAMIKKMQQGDFNIRDGTDPELIGAVFKQWVASLSEPPIPKPLQNECIEIGKIAYYGEDDDDDKKAMRNIRTKLSAFIPKLPPTNRRFLYRLASFLKRLVSPPYSNRNKMTWQAVSTVFFPSLMKFSLTPTPGSSASDVYEKSQSSAKFLEYLLMNFELLSDDSVSKNTTVSGGKNAKKTSQSDDEDEEDEDEDDEEEESDKKDKKGNSKPTKNGEKEIDTSKGKPAATSSTALSRFGGVPTPAVQAVQAQSDRFNQKKAEEKAKSVESKGKDSGKGTKKSDSDDEDEEDEDDEEDSDNGKGKKAAVTTKPPATNVVRKPAKESDDEDEDDDKDDAESDDEKSAKPSAPSTSSSSSSQTSSLNAEIARLKTENEALKKSSTQSSSSFGFLKSSPSDAKLKSERDQFEKDLKALQDKMKKTQKESDEEKKKMEAEIKKLKSSSSTGKSSGKDAKDAPKDTAELTNLRSKVSTLESENKELQLKLMKSEEVSEEVPRLQSLINALHSQIDILKGENDALRSRHLQFDELTINQKELDKAKKSNDKTILSVANAYVEMSKRVKFLETAYKEADETLVQCRAGWHVTIKMIQDKADQLEAEVKKLNELLKAESSEGKGKGSKGDDGNVDTDLYYTVQKKNAKLQNKLSSLQQQFDETSVELQRVQVELSAEREKVTKMGEANDSLKEELRRTGIALKTIADDNFELKEFMRKNTKGKKKKEKDGEAEEKEKEKKGEVEVAAASSESKEGSSANNGSSPPSSITSPKVPSKERTLSFQ